MIKVKVPATSANLGPGFDALGLSLNLYNTFIFQEIEKGLEIIGGDKAFANEKNLVYRGMLKTFERVGYSPKGIKIHMESQIPISRGLGSSAACILGGVVGANYLAGDPLSKEEILELATEIEGHPDNIAPAFLGGLVVSIMEGKKIIYDKVKVQNGIKFVALIPNFTLSTAEARRVLPKDIPYGDGVHNISRVALLLSAFTNGSFELLKYAVKDTLHQPYRGRLIPNYFNIVSKSEALGCLGVYLSGAGPTIMTMIHEDDNSFIQEIKNYLKSLDNTWSIKELQIDLAGTIIEKTDKNII